MSRELVAQQQYPAIDAEKKKAYFCILIRQFFRGRHYSSYMPEPYCSFPLRRFIKLAEVVGTDCRNSRHS